MKRKFKIMYPAYYPDKTKAGKPYLPPENCWVVMGGGGVFFLYNNEQYYPSIQKLSKVLSKYDVVWKD